MPWVQVPHLRPLGTRRPNAYTVVMSKLSPIRAIGGTGVEVTATIVVTLDIKHVVGEPERNETATIRIRWP